MYAIVTYIRVMKKWSLYKWGVKWGKCTVSFLYKLQSPVPWILALDHPSGPWNLDSQGRLGAKLVCFVFPLGCEPAALF